MKYLLLPLFLLFTAVSVAAQGANVAFGTIRQDTGLPVEITADDLSVDQTTDTAIFSGNVLIGQGEMRLTAARVLVVYRAESEGIARITISTPERSSCLAMFYWFRGATRLALTR